MALRASRGETAWALGEPSTDFELPETELRWRAPSGSARLLSSVADVAAMRGAVRLVGEADPNLPIMALELRIQSRTTSSLLTPLPAGVDVEVVLAPSDQITPQDQGADGVLRLELLVSAPGRYSFESAVVVYRDPAPQGGSS